MKSRLKLKIKKRLHRNIGLTLLLLLSFYIAYKIYETQQRIKQRQRHQFRGVCIEGMTPDESKKELNKAIKDAIEACEEECPVDKGACPKKSECDKDDKECKDESTECNSNVRTCKAACKPDKKK